MVQAALFDESHRTGDVEIALVKLAKPSPIHGGIVPTINTSNVVTLDLSDVVASQIPEGECIRVK